MFIKTNTHTAQPEVLADSLQPACGRTQVIATWTSPTSIKIRALQRSEATRNKRRVKGEPIHTRFVQLNCQLLVPAIGGFIGVQEGNVKVEK